METLVLDGKSCIGSKLPIIDFSPRSHLYSEGCCDDWHCSSSARKSRIFSRGRQNFNAAEHEGIPADQRKIVGRAPRVRGRSRLEARAADRVVAAIAEQKTRGLGAASQVAHQRAAGRADQQSVHRTSD